MSNPPMPLYRGTIERYLTHPKSEKTILAMQETAIAGLLTLGEIMQYGPSLPEHTMAGLGELVQELSTLAYITLEDRPDPLN